MEEGLYTLDSVVFELEREKVLTLRRSRERQRSTANQRTVYTHVLNVFKGAFREGSGITIRTVIESLQGAATAVGNALQKVTGALTNRFSIRANQDDNQLLAEAYLTANADYNHVLVPLKVGGVKATNGEMQIDPTKSLLRTMKDDVRRLFAFAIAVEGEYMFLWYLSRPLYVKTAPISMANHPDVLIKTLVAFLSATNEQLGYDPLITPPDGSYARRSSIVLRIRGSNGGYPVVCRLGSART